MTHITILKQTALAVSAGMLFTACYTSDHESRRASTGYDSGSYSSAGSQSRIDEASGAQAQIDSSQGSGAKAQINSSQSDLNSQETFSTSQESSAKSSQDQVVIPLHEERMTVGKKTVDAGQVTIRKIVRTETVNQPVELRRETLVIDREPAGAQSSSLSSSASAQSSSEWQPGAKQSSDAQFSAGAQLGSSGAGVSASAGKSDASASSANSDLGGGAFQEQTYTIQLHAEEPMIQKNVVQSGRVVARKSTQMQQQNLQEQVRREDVQLEKGAAGENVEIRGNFNTAGQQLNEAAGAQRESQPQPQSQDLKNSNSSQDLQIQKNQSDSQLERDRLESNPQPGTQLNTSPSQTP